MNLRNIDWPSALAHLRRQATGPDGRRRLAQSASLAARFASTFEEGAAYALEAGRIEPLNPLHPLRLALHCLRFGLHERALSLLDSLGAAGELPAARVVRALATLQSGEDRRAANIARELLTAHPSQVSAMFLQAEAQLARQPKEAEARAQTLPRDANWATAWTHLLVKQIVARRNDAARLTKQHLELRPVVAKGSPHELLVRTAAAWSAAPAEELASALADVQAGSRAEELVLSLLSERLSEDASRVGTGAVLRTLYALHRAHPNRPAVRRVYVAALTRSAIERATREEWQPALSAIQVAARLEPHEPVHLQNRAAVLTAMADDAQHEAWSDLDRLNQRLALSGRLDPEMARQIARSHRMFAEQARLTPGAHDAPGAAASGVFKVKEETLNGTVTRTLELNQARIQEDPEALRQLLHHRRAELVFRHVALGSDPRRVLLEPEDLKTHRARARALALTAESLATLVAEEGRLLADSFARGFGRLRPGRTRYRHARAAPLPDDAGTSALKLQYASAIADFVTLAWAWEVDPKRLDIVEELLDTVDATVPFLDSEALKALLGSEQTGELGNARTLNMLVRSTIQATDGVLSLGHAERQRLANRVAAELLITLASRLLDAAPSLLRPELERALAIIDRARARDPEYPRVEYMAARMLTIGEYYDEARVRAERFGRIAGKDSPFQRGIEEILRLLAEKKKAKVLGNARSGAPRAEAGAADGSLREDDSDAAGVQRLEDELERFPTSVQLYEELSRVLCRTGQFDVAKAWTTRAIGRCLTRKAQLRARSLDLEVSALQLLSRAHFDAVEIYLSGSRGTALASVDRALAQAGTDSSASYPLHYLRGICLLARHDHQAAELAFRAALQACPAQLHRAALRPLAENVELALLDQSKVAVESALAAGKTRDAMYEIAAALAATRAPEAYLLELAQVYFAVAVAEATQAAPGDSPSELPSLPVLDAARAPWHERLVVALADRSPVGRARAVALLALELHGPSGKEATVLLRRIETFRAELAFIEAIAESTRLERRGDMAAALAVLEGAGERALTDVRGLRLRVMLLLRLDRFEDADTAFELVKASEHPSARGLVDKYPELRFKYGLGAATRLLRANQLDRAHAILVALQAVSSDGALECAYSLAFCLARLSYRSLEAGNRDEAMAGASAALALLESKLAAPDIDVARHTRLLELRDRLDTDLSYMQTERT